MDLFGYFRVQYQRRIEGFLNLVQSNSSSSCTLNSYKRSPALHSQTHRSVWMDVLHLAGKFSLYYFMLFWFVLLLQQAQFLFFFCLFETMISYQQVKWKHFTKLLPVFMFACLLKEKIWRIAWYMRGETMAWKGQWWKVSRSRPRLTKNNTCSFISPQTHGAGCSWNTPWLMENCFLTLMNHSSGNTKYIQFLPNMKIFIICSVRFITVFPTSFMHAIKASTSSSAHFKHLHKAE